MSPGRFALVKTVEDENHFATENILISSRKMLKPLKSAGGNRTPRSGAGGDFCGTESPLCVLIVPSICKISTSCQVLNLFIDGFRCREQREVDAVPVGLRL